jgi:lipooligosaccharide transport system permease protein
MLRTIPKILSNVSLRSFRVWQRDFDVYITTWKTNFLPPLLEPLFYVLAFGVGLGSLIGALTYQERSVPYLDFMVPGIIAVAIMFWSFFENTYASYIRMYYQKTFDAIVATPLLVEDLIVGEILWGATKSILAAVIMLAVLSGFGLVNYPSGLLVLPLALIGGLLFASLGIICTAVVPNIDTFNFPIFLVVFPMFMFSGTFFPIDILPGWAAKVAWCLPLTHISFLVRGATLGWFPESWGVSVVYLLAFTIATFVAALTIMRRRLVK